MGISYDSHLLKLLVAISLSYSPEYTTIGSLLLQGYEIWISMPQGNLHLPLTC